MEALDDLVRSTVERKPIRSGGFRVKAHQEVQPGMLLAARLSRQRAGSRGEHRI